MQLNTKKTTKFNYLFLIIVIIPFLIINCEENENTIMESISTDGNSIVERCIDNSANYKPKKYNKKIIDQFYKQFYKENIKSLISLFTDDAQLFINGQTGIVPFSGIYTGIKNIEGYFKAFFKATSIKSLVVQYNLYSKNYISSHIILKTFIHSTRKTLDLEYVFRFKLDAKFKIESLALYYDTYLYTTAFTAGGERFLSDIKVLSDNYIVKNANYDCSAIVDHTNALFMTGDLETLINLYISDDLEITFKCPNSVPWTGTFYGPNGLTTWFWAMVSNASPIFQERHTTVIDGNRLDVFIHEAWVVAASGKTFNIELLNSFRFDNNGKITGFISINDSKAIYDAFQP